jgi:Pyrroline-5-carboxylate reductase
MTISLGVIGGGNMAQAIIAGVQRTAPDLVNAVVAEPNAETRNTALNHGNQYRSTRHARSWQPNDYSVAWRNPPQVLPGCAKT